MILWCRKMDWEMMKSWWFNGLKNFNIRFSLYEIKMQKIAVTWSKWKTSLVRLIEYLLLWLKQKCLVVDNDSIRKNWKVVLDAHQAKLLWDYIPTRVPWRFLLLWFNKQKNKFDVDCFLCEAALWNRISGLWYNYHEIWVFTNVYDEHTWWEAIKNIDDVAINKLKFITRISTNWTLVYNWDDKLITKYLRLDDKTINQIVVKNSKNKDVNWTINIIINWCDIIIENLINNQKIEFKTKDYDFALNWIYEPSLYNIAFALWTIIAYLWYEQFSKIIVQIDSLLKMYTLPIEWGRLYLFKYKGKTVILDYAHEKQSLKNILQLWRSLATNKVIWVVRIAPDRFDDLIKNTWEFIAPYADKFIVYDKIDWIDKKDFFRKSQNLTRLPGDLSSMFSKAIKSKNPNVETIIYWKDAIDYAIQNAKDWDVVVVIVNDPIQTWEFIKKYL